MGNEPMSKPQWTLVLVFAIAAISGCGVEVAEDPATLAARARFTLAQSPPSPMTLSQLSEAIGKSSDTPTDTSVPLPASETSEASTQPVVVIGRVYAGELEPWEPGIASFVLSELPEDGHGEGHDADNCPFCKRRAAKAPTAIVRFVDDKNDTLKIDVRQLFGLEKNQAVVVTGRATPGDFNSIDLVADGIHVGK